MFARARKGRFRPKNPQKYSGNSRNIIYRSGLELQLMIYFDRHPSVIEWKSEEFSIPYVSPIDNKVHRYFPDFWVKLKRNKDLDSGSEFEELIIEVKPSTQTREPKKRKKLTRQFINEVATWGINEAKWAAARLLCEQKGWRFVIMTEKELASVIY